MGATTILVARSRDKLFRISKELHNSYGIPTDMSNPREIGTMINKVMRKYGTIDIVVNNAGVGYDSSIEEINLNKLQYLFTLDFIGPLVAMQKVIPIMKKQGGGSIINISSGTSLMSLPNMAAYSSIKRAMNGLSLTAHEELQKYHINVSVIYPYITKTDFDKNMLRNTKMVQTHIDYEENPGLRPPDNPEYIAQIVVEAIESGKPELYAHEWMKHINISSL